MKETAVELAQNILAVERIKDDKLWIASHIVVLFGKEEEIFEIYGGEENSVVPRRHLGVSSFLAEFIAERQDVSRSLGKLQDTIFQINILICTLVGY